MTRRSYAVSLAGPELDAHLDDLAAMLASVGRHAGHRQRQDGPHVVCSCRLRVQAHLAAVRAQIGRQARPIPPTEQVAPAATAPDPGHATPTLEEAIASRWCVVLPGARPQRIPCRSEEHAATLADRYPGAVIEEPA